MHTNDICTVSRQPGGVPGDGINRDDRTVHLIRSADPVPCDAGAQALRAGALQSGPLRRARRLRRRALGGHHHRALLAARHVPSHQGHAQLHASRRRWPLHPRADVVGLQCQALVQGTHHESGGIGAAECYGYSASVGCKECTMWVRSNILLRKQRDVCYLLPLFYFYLSPSNLKMK
jgi:hypothetical protein